MAASKRAPIITCTTSNSNSLITLQSTLKSPVLLPCIRQLVIFSRHTRTMPTNTNTTIIIRYTHNSNNNSTNIITYITTNSKNSSSSSNTNCPIIINTTSNSSFTRISVTTIHTRPRIIHRLSDQRIRPISHILAPINRFSSTSNTTTNNSIQSSTTTLIT